MKFLIKSIRDGVATVEDTAKNELEARERLTLLQEYINIFENSGRRLFIEFERTT